MGNQRGGHLRLRPPNQNVGGTCPPVTPIIAAPVLHRHTWCLETLSNGANKTKLQQFSSQLELLFHVNSQSHGSTEVLMLCSQQVN